MIVFLTLTVGVVTVSYLYLRHRFNYWQNRGIPCLKPSLLLGNLDGVGEKIHNTINLQLVYENFKIGNKVCGFYLLQSPCIVALDLDLIKNIMIKDFNNFVDRGIYNNAEVDPLSGHLFAIEGDKWRNLRNKLSQHLPVVWPNASQIGYCDDDKEFPILFPREYDISFMVRDKEYCSYANNSHSLDCSEIDCSDLKFVTKCVGLDAMDQK